MIRGVSYRVRRKSNFAKGRASGGAGETIGAPRSKRQRKNNLAEDGQQVDRTYFGLDRFGWKPSRARIRFASVAASDYVIQDGGLFPHRTVQQNIALVPRLEQWPTEKVNTRVSELYEGDGAPA